VIPTFQDLSTHVSDLTMFTAFMAGTAGSLNLCAAVRLPVLVGYVAGAGRSKRHAVILSALFALGVVAGTVLLGLTAAPAEDGAHRILQVNKGLFWALGPTLFLLGVMISGLVDPQLLPERCRGIAGRLTRVGTPGAFLLGGAFGLLQTPACPSCRAELLIVVEAGATKGAAFTSLILLVAFAAGQSLLVLGTGVLTSLMKPDMVAWLRTRMCSIEQRIQLLAGNVLMVLGIYLVIVG